MHLFSKSSKGPPDFSSHVKDKNSPAICVEKAGTARPDAEGCDYSGATTKTDPEEMKLVA